MPLGEARVWIGLQDLGIISGGRASVGKSMWPAMPPRSGFRSGAYSRCVSLMRVGDAGRRSVQPFDVARDLRLVDCRLDRSVYASNRTSE
jgi:hypothetical protein